MGVPEKEKFFGMIIPKKYGGLEFSATEQVKWLEKFHHDRVCWVLLLWFQIRLVLQNY